MRSKDQNYRRERERRLLCRSIRYVNRSGDADDRVVTIEENRRDPHLVAHTIGCGALTSDDVKEMR